MVRELAEEVGLRIRDRDLVQLSDLIVDRGDLKFEYVSFVVHLSQYPLLSLNPVEVRKIQWVPLCKILKRRVVPYFYNTVQHLLEWERSNAVQASLFPEPEAISAGRRRA
jgi:8-oxo-dGTP pyrophosphatase MutT (NUDIX family)